MAFTRFRALLALLAVLLAAAGFGLGRLTAEPSAPGEGSVEVGFARDMIRHHEQAVLMAQLAYDHAEDPLVKAIGYDIALSQQHQIGMMTRWLEEWQVPATGEAPPMAWMGHHESHAEGDDALMPGMASPAQLDDLAEATGPSFETRFLELMIDHHTAGVDMASYAAEHASVDHVRTLAAGMVEAQRNEVVMMSDMLNN
ncbi:DUF305 domain-containing protein [Glycomyces sp. A-F 0318]|uniref:DUF305 domain-containing protein n=1 Tax=Glycomyces amatae TaxID=2881355 RepID=UPI001E2E376D|nr:DUF305 domain-containing protein [Glycomyces amatae]MCD0445107.1 DUF305 domain-containing protein [Glycomyces amatae]